MGTDKLVSLCTLSSILFKLHLWGMVSGIQVRFILFCSSRNPWCDLLSVTACFSPDSSLKMYLLGSQYCLVVLPLLWNMFPTAPLLWNTLDIHSFSKDKPLWRALFNIWLQRAVLLCCPIAGHCFTSLPGGWLASFGSDPQDQALDERRVIYQAKGRRLASVGSLSLIWWHSLSKKKTLLMWMWCAWSIFY